MRLLHKSTFMVTAVALILNSAVLNAETTLKENDAQTAYALGVSFVQNMERFYAEQESLELKLNKEQLLAGVRDAIENKSKLTEEQINEALNKFEQELQEKAQSKAEEDAKIVNSEGQKFREKYGQESGVVKTKSGLLYKIEKEGAGSALKDTDSVVVHYRGKLIDGTEFDSSYNRNNPTRFPLNSVIPGWSEGITMIKKGGKIELVIPPELGYGETTVGNIPANSTLIFEIELLEVNPASR